MSDKGKTKQQLIDELAALRQRVSESETSEGERKRLEGKLGRREASLRRILDNLPDVIFRWSVKKGLEYVSPAVLDVTGYAPDELMGEDPMKGLKLAKSKYRDISANYRKSVTEEGAAPFEEFVFVRKDGSEGHLEVRSVPIMDDKGNIVATEGILRDISRRKEMEEALRESEQRFRQIFEHVADMIFWLDALGQFVILNDRTYDVIGYRPDELIGHSFTEFDLFEAGELEKWTAAFANSFEKGTAATPRLELNAKHKDGHLVPCEVNIGNVIGPEGQLEGLMGIIRDITDRKQAEEELRESEQRFRQIFDNVSDIVFYVNERGEAVTLNQRMYDVFGYHPDEIIGRSFLELGVFDPDELSKVAGLFAGAQETGKAAQPDIELHAKHRDGHELIVEINARELAGPGGELMGFMGVVRDITERKRAEEELRQHREHLEELVEERTAELTKTQEVATRQAQEILEISTPILQLRKGVLLAPLLGMMSSHRAQQFTERLLNRLVDTSSTVVLVDITGVPAVDTQTAHYLIRTISAVRLLGAQAILTGVSPGISRTLVELGIDLSSVVTRSSMEDGLRDAMNMLNQ